nr:hypothetical protein B0A51_04620 [Rachicladosporium sp. CCFEE 5018]
MDSPRSTKRERSHSPERDLLTPPNGIDDHVSKRMKLDIDNACDVLNHATRVLAIEAEALAAIRNLYQTDNTAQQGLLDAVQAVLNCQERRGKLVVTGVGKSAYIAQKFVATCKSLGVAASFMHACEAVHGDLGDIREHDIVLFVSYSGKTPELLNLLPHIPASTRLMALSSHSHFTACPLLHTRADSILLPTPIPEKEEISFSVSAPTTSTTVTLAVADMLALTIAEQLHQTRKKEVFARNHPGGAIGVAYREVVKVEVDVELKKAELEVLELPSPSISGSDDF